MNDSILITIKKLLGINFDDPAFDPDIIMAINSVFMTLRQIGIGPVAGFSIQGTGETWSDYISDMSKLESVRYYVYLKTRMLFDPPDNGNLAQAIKDNIAELEWRLHVEIDPGPTVFGGTT